MLEDVGNQLITRIAKATSEAPDGKAQTAAGIKAYFRWVHDDRDQFRLLFSSGARRDDDFADAIRRVEDATAEAIAPLIAVEIDPEHQRTIAHGLVGLAEGVSRRLISDEATFDPDVVARRLSDLAWAGLRVDPPALILAGRPTRSTARAGRARGRGRPATRRRGARRTPPPDPADEPRRRGAVRPAPPPSA